MEMIKVKVEDVVNLVGKASLSLSAHSQPLYTPPAPSKGGAHTRAVLKGKKGAVTKMPEDE